MREYLRNEIGLSSTAMASLISGYSAAAKDYFGSDEVENQTLVDDFHLGFARAGAAHLHDTETGVEVTVTAAHMQAGFLRGDDDIMTSYSHHLAGDRSSPAFVSVPNSFLGLADQLSTYHGNSTDAVILKTSHNIYETVDETQLLSDVVTLIITDDNGTQQAVETYNVSDAVDITFATNLTGSEGLNEVRKSCELLSSSLTCPSLCWHIGAIQRNLLSGRWAHELHIRLPTRQ